MTRLSVGTKLSGPPYEDLPRYLCPYPGCNVDSATGYALVVHVLESHGDAYHPGDVVVTPVLVALHLGRKGIA